MCIHTNYTINIHIVHYMSYSFHCTNNMPISACLPAQNEVTVESLTEVKCTLSMDL